MLLESERFGSGMGPDGGCGWAGSSAMGDIWNAASAGDVSEVERLVVEDRGLLDARISDGYTPLMLASMKGHVEVVRCLLDKGAAMNEGEGDGQTALYKACSEGHLPVVRLLVERGADPSIVDNVKAWTPLIIASIQGHVEVVRSLLGHPGAKATTNQRAEERGTALWWACCFGRGGIVRALLESGADPTIAVQGIITPMAVAKHEGQLPQGVTVEGRRDCVAALEVSFLFIYLYACPL
jgi:uncharacterized protein